MVVIVLSLDLQQPEQNQSLSPLKLFKFESHSWQSVLDATLCLLIMSK